MIRALTRPGSVLFATAALFVVCVGAALTAANLVPVTHAGANRVPLPESLLAATVQVDPKTLNPNAPGDATVFVTLPGPHTGEEIIPSSVEMCLQHRCTSSTGPWMLEGNGTFQLKFDRGALSNVLLGAQGWVTLTVDGELSTAPGRFEGSDSVRIN